MAAFGVSLMGRNIITLIVGGDPINYSFFIPRAVEILPSVRVVPDDLAIVRPGGRVRPQPAPLPDPHNNGPLDAGDGGEPDPGPCEWDRHARRHSLDFGSSARVSRRWPEHCRDI